MTERATTFDCDVFCLGNFKEIRDISITGNLFVKGSMAVSSFEAGENIIVTSDGFVKANSLKALGEMDIVSLFFDVQEIDALGGMHFQQITYNK